MDLDADVSRWVLELLLRDRDKDSLSKRVLAVAPLSDHDLRLKKTLLLRSIESQILEDASVGESILDSLESIESLDRREGTPATTAMRAAYCAVATETTVKFLVCSGGKPTGKYMEAVDRVWRGRVRVLEETEGCELVAAEAREMRDEVEAGIWDQSVARKLAGLNSRNDALRAVAAYVKEAMAVLGAPFIAWAVRFRANKGSEEVAVENEGNVGPVRVADGVDLEVRTVNGVELGDGDIEENEEDNVCRGGSEAEVRREDGDVALRTGEEDVEEANGANDGVRGCEREARDTIAGDVSDPLAVTAAFVNWMSEMNKGGVSSQAATKGKDTPRTRMVTRAPRHRHGPAKLRDDEDVGEASAGIYNSVSSAKVRNVQEKLKSSVLALNAAVTDPLSYALRISETIRSELGSRHVDHISKENGGASERPDVPQPIGNEDDAPARSSDIRNVRENAGTGDVNPRNPSSIHQKIVTRASLMGRNSTAHTYEWDDSLGMSPEDANRRGKLHLPSPKRIAVSPLKKYEDKRVTKRRKVKRWSLEEEDALRTGVQKYGVGNWKTILAAYLDALEERTEVDLKDKWRNMTRWGQM